MSARFAEKGGNFISAILRFFIRFAANTMRGLIIVGRYTWICWQQKRLRRAWRRLGQLVHSALDEGEVNPMLTEPVKDAVLKARNLKALKDRQYEAIAALREKMRGIKAPEAVAPSPEEPSEPKEPPKEPGA
jgi:hypothetical protein